MSVIFHIEVTPSKADVRATRRAFRELGSSAQKELREESQKIAADLVPRLRSAASADSRQSAHVGRVVRATKAAVPSVVATHPWAFSSEFGQNRRSGWYAAPRYFGSRGRQWHRWIGQASYWFFKNTTESAAVKAWVYRRYVRVVVRLLNKWGAGG